MTARDYGGDDENPILGEVALAAGTSPKTLNPQLIAAAPGFSADDVELLRSIAAGKTFIFGLVPRADSLASRIEAVVRSATRDANEPACDLSPREERSLEVIAQLRGELGRLRVLIADAQDVATNALNHRQTYEDFDAFDRIASILSRALELKAP